MTTTAGPVWTPPSELGAQLHDLYGLTCPPMWGPPRRPYFPTFGPHVAKIMDALGTPPMPWQRYVADVALEVDPDTGVFAYREVDLSVMRQQGKALDLDTPLLTSRGWRSMRTVKPGDQVFHPSGRMVPVTFVSEVMTGHDCYRITTTDGRSLVADADHLWTVQDTRSQPKRPWRTLTTRELAGGGLMRSARDLRFRLPVQRAIDSPDVDLPLDPYLLGVWLGDGTSRKAEVTSADPEIFQAFAAAGYEPTYSHMTGKAATRGLRGLLPVLRQMDLLQNKHVPDQYLAAGLDQRLALLQGLMDTDGSISAGSGGTPRAEFSTTRQPLADAVLYLARSLGWRTSCRQGRATLHGRDCGPKWRVCFTPTTMDPSPFRLARKATRIQTPRDRGGERHAVSIASVQQVPSRPVRCIKVDSPDGLFLAGRDLVATHNTALVLGKMIHRMRAWNRQRVIYTAQSRNDARDKLLEDFLQPIEAGPPDLARQFRARKGLGQEAIVCLPTRSRMGITSLREEAGHGATLDDGVIDEAFAHPDARLEQSMSPAMLTRVMAQLWVLSAAGTEKSTYWNEKRERGRERIERLWNSGLTQWPSICYFEWFAPDELAFDDPATWWFCMPALGYTITEQVVKAELEKLGQDEFERGMLNRTKKFRPPADPNVPTAEWPACLDLDSQPGPDIALAFDISPDRKHGAIVAAGPRADGQMHIEVVDYRPGTAWIVPRLLELKRRWRPIAIGVDDRGPASTLLAELAELGIIKPIKADEPRRGDLVVTNAQDMARACGQIADAVRNGQLRHIGQSELDAALAGATTRSLGDTYAWGRRAAQADICPLVAATLARWAYLARAALVRDDYDALASIPAVDGQCPHCDAWSQFGPIVHYSDCPTLRKEAGARA